MSQGVVSANFSHHRHCQLLVIHSRLSKAKQMILVACIRAVINNIYMITTLADTADLAALLS